MTANLERDGRLTMTLALDGGMSELRCTRAGWRQVDSEVPLAFFEAELQIGPEPSGPIRGRHRRHHLPLHDPSGAAPLGTSDRGAAGG